MRKTILVTLILLFTFSIYAQAPADIDAGFNIVGWFGKSAVIKKIAHSPDGKIMVCGNINFYHGASVNNIVRLNVDGTLDTSFNPGTIFSSSVTTFALQPDGKVLVSGTGSSTLFKRLNEDGSVDTTFNIPFVYNAQCIAIQSDGKILAGSDSQTFQDKLIRLNANGSIDSSFDSQATTIISTRCIIIEPGGKIIVGGDPTAVLDAPSLVRLNPTGTIDNTFSSAVFSQINTLARQPDGKIIVGGKLRYNSDLGDAHNLARITTNGQLDVSFEPGDVDFLEVYASAIREDGKILIGGRFLQYNQNQANNIACLNLDGTIDENFDSGTGFNYHIYALDAYAGNTFFAGGDYSFYNDIDIDSLVRINSDGSLNPEFAVGSLVYSAIGKPALSLQTDDKIIVAGSFDHYDNMLTRGLIRFNSDGSEDTSLDTGSGFKLGNDSGLVRAAAIQSDGKIILGGSFRDYNGSAVINMIRINSNGSIDNTFTNGSQANLDYNVHKVLIQPDGKILIAGSGYSSWNTDKIIRFNSDSTLDVSFSMTVFNGTVEAIMLQPDGKIILGGKFTTCNTLPAPHIIRLNPDGTIDTTFNTGTGFSNSSDYVNCLALQQDGKIIAGGYLRNFNGNTTRKYLLRLDGDGTIDDSFNNGSGFSNGYPTSLTLDSEGRILTGGIFTTYSETTSQYLIRLNVNSTVDSEFNVGSGFNVAPFTTVMSNDGKIIVVGGFSSYNGSIVKQIIRLQGNAVLATQNNDFINKLSICSNPVKDILQLRLDDFTFVKSYAIFDFSGKEVKFEKTVDFNNSILVTSLSKGLYILKVETNHGQIAAKFIKE